MYSRASANSPKTAAPSPASTSKASRRWSLDFPRIEVKFLIDANGILHVSAREQRSGKEAEVEVKPTYGLTDEQVESMILDSFDNAETDITERQVIEAGNEAETILTAVQKAKSGSAWQQLTFDEIASIEASSKELKASLEGGDYKIIATPSSISTSTLAALPRS